MVSARGACPILTALITCVRLAHMWSVVRWADSWDWGSIVSQQAVRWGFANSLLLNLISKSPQDPYQASWKRTSTDIMASRVYPGYILNLEKLLLCLTTEHEKHQTTHCLASVKICHVKALLKKVLYNFSFTHLQHWNENPRCKTSLVLRLFRNEQCSKQINIWAIVSTISSHC